MIKKLLYTLIRLAFVTGVLHGNSMVNHGRFALCDTTQREQALYAPIFDIFSSLSMPLEYYGFDQLMDEKSLQKKFEGYKGIFFIFGTEFLKAIQTSPVVDKFLHFVREYSRKKNILVGFIFPPSCAPIPGNIITKLPRIFSGLHGDGNPPSFNDFSLIASRFLQIPCEVRELSYHTTLHGPREGKSFFSQEVDQILHEQSVELVKTMPSRDVDSFSKTIKKTFPLGVYWNNPVNRNHVFISSTTFFTFSGISESFRFTPVSAILRKELLHALFSTFSELQELLIKKRSVPKKARHLFSDYGKPLSIQHNSTLKKISWMELVAFQDKEYSREISKKERERDLADRKIRQDLLIEYIIKSGLDSLWISLTPNIYYSYRAREPHHQKRFIDSVALFTKKLSRAAYKAQRQAPKILVGFEIADNLYPPHLPMVSARDLYNNEYLDIPCPTDTSFWQEEVIKPLVTFVNAWKCSSVNNGLQLAGIVLDLEMYGRKITGTFGQMMGFETSTIQSFLDSKNLSFSLKNVHDFTQFLMKNKLTQEYYMYLEEQAYNIGSLIAQEVRCLIPDALIACYTPVILVDWFYKGLYKGMSDTKHPLHLFTFNVECNAHKQWFDDHGIVMYHSSVLLLSKIKQEKNFEWVNAILKHHHGIWFNRFSRMIEDYDPASWIHIEQTPMDKKGKDRFINHILEAS